MNFKMQTLIKYISAYLDCRNDLKKLKKQKGQDSLFPFAKKRLILNEKFSDSGIASGHYFHQDLLVAHKIFQNNPKKHVDIGSRTDGFVAHVATFREIEVFDIRTQNKKIKNIIFKKADLTELPNNLIDYTDSISSLHAIEHFGLGRYNDAIDYWGYLKAIENITKILKSGGRFYFSTPIGKQRIEFNAHRVFAVEYLLELFKANYTLFTFSYVNDEGDLFENIELNEEEIKRNLGCTYGCGIFELIKK